MNKGYANTLKEITGNPIQGVDKFHLFQEANKMIDEVRRISIWALAMNFIKIEDIPKLGKKVGKKLTKKDIDKLRTDSGNKIMKKYKDMYIRKLTARFRFVNLDIYAYIFPVCEKESIFLIL